MDSPDLLFHGSGFKSAYELKRRLELVGEDDETYRLDLMLDHGDGQFIVLVYRDTHRETRQAHEVWVPEVEVSPVHGETEDVLKEAIMRTGELAKRRASERAS